MIYGTAAGRITKDAELKYTASGKSVLSFTVASDVGYGENKHAVFTRCSMWGKRGEAVEAYAKKGTPVTVIGSLDLREWESNGKSGTSLEMNVQELVLQGSRQGGETKPEQSQGFRKPAQQEVTEPDFADDIPFSGEAA